MAPWGPVSGTPLRVRVSHGDHKILTLLPTLLFYPYVNFSHFTAFFSSCFLSPSGAQPLLNSPPSFVCWSRGFMEMDGQGELVESLKRFCASTRLPPTPLLLFPEEEATNGWEGLLRFR